jgi:hypothetical protein
MCYADGGPQGASANLTFDCPQQPDRSQVFDCGQDDYFNPVPTAGSYLATHWNTYDSPWMCPADTCGPAPATASVAGGVLTYSAPPGRRTSSSSTSPAPMTSSCATPAAGIKAVAPCRRDPDDANQVLCPTSSITSLNIQTGDKNDSVEVDVAQTGHHQRRRGRRQLTGGDGDDSLLGSDGNDLLAAATAATRSSGGANRDTVTYDGRSVGVTVDMDGVADDGSAADAQADNVKADVEDLTGTDGDDDLTATRRQRDRRRRGRRRDVGLGRAGHRDLRHAHGRGDGDDRRHGQRRQRHRRLGDRQRPDRHREPDRRQRKRHADRQRGREHAERRQRRRHVPSGWAARTRSATWVAGAAVTADIDGVADDGGSADGTTTRDNIDTDVENLTGWQRRRHADRQRRRQTRSTAPTAPTR